MSIIQLHNWTTEISCPNSQCRTRVSFTGWRRCLLTPNACMESKRQICIMVHPGRSGRPARGTDWRARRKAENESVWTPMSNRLLPTSSSHRRSTRQNVRSSKCTSFMNLPILALCSLWRDDCNWLRAEWFLSTKSNWNHFDWTLARWLSWIYSWKLPDCAAFQSELFWNVRHEPSQWYVT